MEDVYFFGVFLNAAMIWVYRRIFGGKYYLILEIMLMHLHFDDFIWSFIFNAQIFFLLNHLLLQWCKEIEKSQEMF